MRTIELNIGLENNPYAEAFEGHILHKRLVHAVIGSSIYGFEVVQYAMNVSEWQGSPERTFVVVLKTDMYRSDFIDFVEKLCDIFQQDAIAGTFNGEGHLIYNSNHSGLKDSFDYRFFKSLQGSNTMTGQIPSNVGFRSTQGHIRKLSLRDQLQRVLNLRGVNTITHPVHGEIKVSNDTARGLLDSTFTDAEIIRLKLNHFNN